MTIVESTTTGSTAFAPWSRRLLALLIDLAVTTIPIWLLPLITSDDAAGWAFVGGALWLVIVVVYFTVSHGAAHGQTVGKRTLKIRVVRAGGGRVGYARAFGRIAVVLAFMFVGALPLVVDLFLPLFDQRRQALHDKVVDTLVIDA